MDENVFHSNGLLFKADFCFDTEITKVNKAV